MWRRRSTSWFHWVIFSAWAHQREVLPSPVLITSECAVYYVSALWERAVDSAVSAIHPGSISSWEMPGEGDAVTAMFRTAGSHPVASVAEKVGKSSFCCRLELWIHVTLYLCHHLKAYLLPTSDPFPPETPTPSSVLSSPEVSCNLTS